MRKPIGFLPTLVLGLASAIVAIGPVLAAPVTYTEQGTGTGSLDGVAFTNASILLTMINDTTDVVSGPTPATVSITGTATVNVNNGPSETFTDPVTVFSRTIGPSHIAGFGGPVGTASILNTVNPIFATYDLTTSIGPISGFDGSIPFTFPTSSGDFRIDNAQGRTTIFTAVVSPAVPEPSSLTLLGIALASVALLRRRRAQP
jgi:PEP-CTERM motif